MSVDTIRKQGMVPTTFLPKDVTILAKDVSPVVAERGVSERERDKQLAGRHYSMDLPKEQAPTEEYSKIFEELLECHGEEVAYQVMGLCKGIYERLLHLYKTSNGYVLQTPVAFVSLLRAGTPIGVLVKRTMEILYGFSIPHYSVSIIRDVGIDINAMDHLSAEVMSAWHSDEANFDFWDEDIQYIFVDGWVGKGRIKQELEQAMFDYEQHLGYSIDWKFVTLSDPVGCTDVCASKFDTVIPTACLNSTACGLVSRSVFNPEFIGDDDFHGSKFYEEFRELDRTYDMINSVMEYVLKYRKEHTDDERDSDNSLAYFGNADSISYIPACIQELRRKYNLPTIDYVKPGVGETTRVLLRRVPDRVLINSKFPSIQDKLPHIVQLCKEKQVPIEDADLGNYWCCGIIQHIVGERAGDI